MDEEQMQVRARIEQEVMSRWHADGAQVSLGRMFDRMAKLEVSSALAVRGFRRWKRNQKRGGDRHEADNGMTDLGQGVYELAELLGLNK